ncbi:MAG: PolC-type DNA polymerase III [Oscillospiraceae bacterium]|nr:PolC-type DNA polymerase III [Oscillospiraceae bacterium]
MEQKQTMTFYEVFRVGMGEEPHNPICDAIVESVSINKETSGMNVSVRSEVLCDGAAISAVRKELETRYHLARVKLIVKYPEQLCDEAYLENLKQQMIREFPQCCALLGKANWSYSSGVVQIELRNGGEQYLKDCARRIETEFWNSFEKRVHVEFFEQELTPEELEKEQEELRARMREEQERLAALAPKPVPQPKKEEPSVKKPWNGKMANKRLATVDGDALLGKPQFDEVVPMKGLDDSFGKVTIEGDVFECDHVEITARDLFILKFDMTDYSGSMRVSRAMPMAEGKELAKVIKPGMRLRVHGTLNYDMYAQDLVLKAQNIIETKKEIRKDKAEKKRVELHLHTNMSEMDGMTEFGELAKRAAYWEHPAIAVTDHGVVQAFPDAMKAAEKNNLKVIYGVEAYFVNNAKPIRALVGHSDVPLSGEFVCFDIETTGLNNQTEAITEIAAVVLRNGELAETFHTYVDPKRPIPEKITQLTGISSETVKGAPEIEEALKSFLAFANDRVLVAHNAEFDIGFLKVAAERLGIEYNFVSLDTLAMARVLLPDLSKHRLNVVAQALDLPAFTHHRAADDAATVAYMLAKFILMLRESSKTKLVSEINADLTNLSAGKVGKVRAHHLIILVKDYVGLKNLYKLVSLAHLKYYNKRPIIPRSVLDQYREGLIIGSACEAGELYGAIVAGRPDEELREIASYYDYLEIQPIGNNAFMVEKGLVESIETIRNFNRKVLSLGDELGIPTVATGDVHFLEPHDEVYRRVLMAGKGFSDADNQAPLYLKTTDEMLEEFAYLGEDRAYEVVVENTNKIADLCETIRPIPKEQFPPSIEGSKEELVNMCRARARELYGDPLPKIVDERLEYELDKITTHGFDVMYIIAQKLVSRSIAEGYLVGSRGSVGSSVVAYFSGITEVNALAPHYRCPNCKHSEFIENQGYGAGVDMPDRVCPNCGTEYQKDGFDIPFATFLGFDGDKTPDIDLNFSGEYQGRAHRHTIEIFGEDNVFRAGTISAVQKNTAFGFVRNYLEERGMHVTRAEEGRMVVGCTGIKRTTGQHPGGVMIVPKEKEIYDFSPVQHPANDITSDIITTHFDYHSIHDNILKLDLLGHDDPTMIRMLEQLSGLNARQIPLDDKDTMSIFTSLSALGIEEDPILGKTGSVAVPEFGTKFVREMLVDTKPGTFDELVRISGLSHGTDVWLNNAQTLVKEGTATLKEVICARDDIMLYLISKGVEPKLSFTIMESVRKGKGLKPEWEEEMSSHNVPKWYIDSCKKIKYMFPKAHAVAYVMMAFRIAWFKVHHPLAFYAAYFSVRAKAFDAQYMINGDGVVLAKMEEIQKKEKPSPVEKEMLVTLEVCHEFYARGFKFDPIDLYQSDAVNFQITETGLLPPFTAIPGLGEVAARGIMAERVKSEFISVDELQSRCNKVSKAVVELLTANHVLDDIPATSQMSLF